jgi:hypothetical protein
MNNIRKIFSVYIREKSYDVYDIEGKEHAGYNDMPKTWWLYFNDTDLGGAMPPPDSESFVPFVKGIERRVWEFNIKQQNTTKYKWDETRFSSTISVSMSCNGKVVYEFQSGGGYLYYAMAQIQYLMVQMSEHPFDFFNSEKENGRKICWYGLPATVRISTYRSWEIDIVPEYTKELPKSEWWKELARREFKYTEPDAQWEEIEKENRAEDVKREYIHWGDALSDQHIYWFRK